MHDRCHIWLYICSYCHNHNPSSGYLFWLCLILNTTNDLISTCLSNTASFICETWILIPCRNNWAHLLADFFLFESWCDAESLLLDHNIFFFSLSALSMLCSVPRSNALTIEQAILSETYSPRAAESTMQVLEKE